MFISGLPEGEDFDREWIVVRHTSSTYAAGEALGAAGVLHARQAPGGRPSTHQTIVKRYLLDLSMMAPDESFAAFREGRRLESLSWGSLVKLLIAARDDKTLEAACDAARRLEVGAVYEVLHDYYCAWWLEHGTPEAR